MNYYKYEKKHLKCTTFWLFLILSLSMFFLETALNASVASGASNALHSADAASESCSFSLLRYTLFFALTISTLNSALFQMREQGSVLPILIKYRFAPVDIRKMYCAKSLLVLRGALFFYAGTVIIFAAVWLTVIGFRIPPAEPVKQLGYALIFCVIFTFLLLLRDWIDYHAHNR